MDDADRRIRRVDGLSARPARVENLEIDVLGSDLDFDLLRFWKNGDGRRGRVDPTLRFGYGYTLNPVYASLVFEA